MRIGSFEFDTGRPTIPSLLNSGTHSAGAWHLKLPKRVIMCSNNLVSSRTLSQLFNAGKEPGDEATNNLYNTCLITALRINKFPVASYGNVHAFTKINMAYKQNCNNYNDISTLATCL